MKNRKGNGLPPQTEASRNAHAVTYTEVTYTTVTYTTVTYTAVLLTVFTNIDTQIQPIKMPGRIRESSTSLD